MKVLHVSLKPIYPKIDGGCVAMENFLNLLVDSFNEVDHVCISTSKHQFDKKIYFESLPEKVKFKGDFHIDTSIHFLKLIGSLFTNESYQVKRFYSAELALFLEKNADKYDALFFESAFLFPSFFNVTTKAKIYFRTHNVEYKIWETKSACTSNVIQKKIYQKFSKQLKFLELTNYEKVDGLIHISTGDEQVFKTALPEVNQVTIPLSIENKDLITPNFNDKSLLQFGFIGSQKWKPNSDALDELIGHIFPQILTKWDNANLVVAGSGTDNFYTTNSKINSLGTVDSVCEFYDLISIFLAPLTSGSGLKIKVVEAICHGKIVIGSPIAFEGLEFLSHKQIAISPADYLQCISEIILNNNIQELVLTQQKEIERNFGKKNLISKLRDFVS